MNTATVLIANAAAVAAFGAAGVWRMAVAQAPSVLGLGIAAMSAALLVLMGCTYAAYAFPWARDARDVAAHLVVPVLFFVAVLAYARVRNFVSNSQLAGTIAMGLAALWFFGFYLALLVACHFGDCL